MGEKGARNRPKSVKKYDLGQNIDNFVSKHARNHDSDPIFMPRRQFRVHPDPISETLWAQIWSPFPDPQDPRNLRFLAFLRILGIWESGKSRFSQISQKCQISAISQKVPISQTPPVSDRTWSFRDSGISPAPDMSESMSGLATMLRLGSVKFRHCCASFLLSCQKSCICVLIFIFPN